jgi:hypothetical protein
MNMAGSGTEWRGREGPGRAGSGMERRGAASQGKGFT